MREAKPGSGTYRYGFNGKENDNEVKGEGDQQDYGMRIYDPRLGRFLSVDPITQQYPELTPYQFASNRPIDGIDLDGMEYISAFKAQQAQKMMHLQIKREIDTRPPEPEILVADIYGNGHSGPASMMINKIGVIKEKYDRALGAAIASGPIASAMYLTNGDEGAFKGAVADQILMGLSGIPANGSSVFRRANNNIEPIRFIPTTEAGGPGKVQSLKPSTIRFSQTSVNGADEIVASMRTNGWKGDPIDVVRMKDGIFTSVDNTRVLAAQISNTPVSAVVHAFDEAIPATQAGRFILKKGNVVPTTWGQAVEFRIQNQNATFRNNTPNGSFEQPMTKTGSN